MATPEGKVKALIKREMKKAFPAAYVFWPVQSGLGSKTLDTLWCIDGQFISIEAKKKDGWYTPLQEEHRDQIRAAGGWVFLVDGAETLAVAIEEIDTRLME